MNPSKMLLHLRWLAAALLLPLCIMVATAGDLPQAAYGAFDRGDYASALGIVRPLAERGDARAQGALGYLHYFGLGVPEDHAEAYRWILRGAEGGDLRSQLRLGILYDMGHGTSRNLWEAARWYRAAAERGDVQAQYNVCVLLFNGDGGLRDLGEARKWCAKAAAQGDQGAQRLLRRIEGPGAWSKQLIGQVTPVMRVFGVQYQAGIVWVKFVGIHAQYDRIDVC